MGIYLDSYNSTYEKLKEGLDKHSSVENVYGIICDYLDTLLDTYKKGCNNSRKIRLASYMTNLLKTAVSVITSACETQIWFKEQGIKTTAETKKPAKPMVIWRIIEAVSASGCIAWLSIKNQIVYLAVFSIILLIEISRIIYNYCIKKKAKEEYIKAFSEDTSVKAKANVCVNLELLITKLSNAVISIDKLLESDLLDSTLPSYDNTFLELLQDFLEAGDYKDADYALKQIKSIPYALSKLGISTEVFTGENRHYFDFIPDAGSGITNFKTLRRALTSEKKVLKKGLVVEPSVEN